MRHSGIAVVPALCQILNEDEVMVFPVNRHTRTLRCGLMCFGAAVLLLGTFHTTVADDYGNWSYSTHITLNTSATGADVSGSVSDFPVLIRLNPGNFGYFSATGTGGTDIRFSSSDGTHLAYQIERWDDNTGDNDSAWIWVKADVTGGSSTQYIVMYWGNGSAADSSDGEAVFATGTQFKAVYHLDNNPADGAGSILDQTANSWDGTPNGMDETDRISGMIGYALDFDGSSHNVDIGNVEIHNESAYTVSMWVKGADGQEDRRCYAEASSADNDPLFTLGTDNHALTPKEEAYVRDNDKVMEVDHGDAQTSADVFDNTWNHVAWVDSFNGSNNTYTWYVDGQASGTGTYTKGTKTFTNSCIGSLLRGAVATYFLTGQIDEVRLDATNRSTDWIKLCYENQQQTQTLVEINEPLPNYTWDNSTSSSIQTGSGTWGTHSYWTPSGSDGTSLGAWYGPGAGATFAGSDGNYTITVSGTQYVNSIIFENSGYRIAGGTALYLANKLTGPVFGFSPPYDVGRDSAAAFDGSTSTFCNDDDASGGYTGIDLGSGNEQQVSYIRYYPRAAFLSRMNGGKFQGSNDGSSYTDLYTISSDPSLAWHTVAVTNTTAWRYLRYLGPTDGRCNVSEVEFYGMGNINVASGDVDTIAAVLAGNSGIRKYGDGYLILSGANTYTGPTEIYESRLQPTTLANGGTASGIGASSNAASNLVISNGVLRYIGGTVECDRLFTLGPGWNYIWPSGTGTLTFTNAGSIAFTGSGARLLSLGGTYAGTNTFSQALSDGPGGVTTLQMESSAATWALTGANTYTGATTIDEGTLSIGNGGTTGAISNSSDIANSGTLIFDRSDSYTYSGVISGSGDLTKEGSGTTTLSGNLTHTGTVTVNDGTLRLTGTPTSNALKYVITTGGTLSVPDKDNLSPYPGSVTADWITINGGTFSTDIETGNSFGPNRGFTLGASGGTIEIPYTDHTNVVTIYSVITGSGDLTKTGPGVLRLSGTNTFSGGVTVSTGMLRAGNTAALGDNGNSITVSSGACIDVNGYNLQGYTNAVTINGQVSSDTGALVNYGSDQLFAIRSISLGSDASIGNDGGGRLDIGREIGTGFGITGNGYTLTKIGNNGVSLLNDGTTIGAVVVNDGTLRLENPDAVGTAPVTVNSGGELNSWWDITFTNALTLDGGTLASAENNSYDATWSGAVSVNSASTLACSADNTTTLSGAITGTGSLTITGDEGVMILSGNSNTYSGGTTVSGATFRVTNSSGSATGTGSVSVASGAILDGTGTIGGTVGMSGTVAPGVDGIGTLTIDDDVTFTGSGTFIVQANGTTAGSGHDQLVMSSGSGTVTLASATLALTLGYMPSINDAFIIIDNQGASAVSGTFDGIAQGDEIVLSYSGVNFDCSVSYIGGTGNDVVVTVEQVSGENYVTDWAYSKSILLNTTATGADVSGDETDFPVLLRLNPGNFDGFANTQPGGIDIRFAKTDGSHLAYEIERWKDYGNDADTAEIWVTLDTVYGDNKTQSFLMYWGKSDAEDKSDGEAVFTTGDGFKAVYHLDEDPSDGTDAIKDRTTNDFDGSPSGMDATDQVDAVIGRGLDFDGSSHYVDLGNVGIHNENAYTVSMWVKGASGQTDKRYFSEASTASNSPLFCMGTDNGGVTAKGEIFIRDDDNTEQLEHIDVPTSADVFDNTWNHIAWVDTFNGSNNTVTWYVDGQASGTASYTKNSKTFTNSCIGAIIRASVGYYFAGRMDEVRLDANNRSADWVKLCYENQKTDQTLVLYEDYSTWGFSRDITINTSGVTTTNCLDFPLLVRLTASDFDFNQAQDSGQDIRFAESNGPHLSYQISRWNKGSEAAEVWVSVDTVYGSNSSQYITMYWGKSGVASRSDGAAVFDTGNGFEGVWHLDEEGNSDAGGYDDATGNAYDAQGLSLGGSSDASGVIGVSQYCDGSADAIMLPTGVSSGKSVFTASLWIKTGETGSSVDHWSRPCLMGMDASGPGTDDYAVQTNSGNVAHYSGLDGNPDDIWVSSTAINDGEWHFVTVVNTGTAIKLYADGSYISSGNDLPASSSLTGSYAFYVGANNMSGTANYFHEGYFDEMVISGSSRSADWINLCYETQKPTPTIITSDSADAFRPLTIRREMNGATTDSIIIATSRWAIRFAADAGGGIDFLAADSSSTDQLDANLFYLLYNSTSSASGSGTLSLLDSSIVFARVRQEKTVDGQPFQIDYTVLGSGKLAVRVKTVASSALSGGLEFRIANNATTLYNNIAFGSTAATCNGVAHIDSGSGKFDLIMAPYDLWSDADAITTNSKYTGLNSSSWSAPAGSRHAWEFMVDFGHTTLADSARAYRHVADYRQSDTLGFFAGTPVLEQAWEYEEKGEWPFNEGTGDTAFDKTGREHDGAISGTPSWTSGKWNSSALNLGGSDSVVVAHSTDFDGTIAHTITAWIRPGALLSSSAILLKKYSSSGVGYAFTGGPSGSIEYRMSNGGSEVELLSTTVLTPGQWYHVAAKMFYLGSQDYLALYIDGMLDTLRSVQIESYFGTNTSDLVIGKEFNGVIDDVRFYRYALSDEEIRAISLRGYAPERGMYRVRADNDNTLHCRMHGSADSRFLPVLQIDNYWATALPTYVYVDGVGLTSGSDYYAALDDNRNRLTIGFNRVINSTSTIFVDDNNATGNQLTDPMKKMYWGSGTIGSDDYFYVKNTPGSYFDDDDDNEFYASWNMSTNSTKQSEMLYLNSSVTNPGAMIDTTVCTNLLPGGDVVQTLGIVAISDYIGYAGTSDDVTAPFTYAVEESSAVRVRLRIDERTVSASISYNIVSRWTLYPTGQFFRYDSIYNLSTDPKAVYMPVFLNDQTNATLYSDEDDIRGSIVYSSGYPDLVTCWLGMKNTSGFQSEPFDEDTIAGYQGATRAGFDYIEERGSGTVAKWDASLDPIERAIYIDFHHAAMNANSMDSIANGVQFIGLSGGNALTSIGSGTLITDSEGDLNGDGFNETEGAYVIQANDNTVSFTLPALGDTCRYYPAFRVTNYSSASKPRYLFACDNDDTIPLVEGYQYNGYLRQSTREYIFQIDSVFCSSVTIYLSFDRTLAVQMSDFAARPGNRCDTLLWKTESEHENLGYRIERRIQPDFFDSVYIAYARADSVGTPENGETGVSRLVKRRLISADDTGWTLVNSELIPGAPSGVSHGPREYQYVDDNLYNGILYEYRLIAVDYHRNEETHGPVAAMPMKLAPAWFMLGPNYPNPFRHATRIWFALPVETQVSLNVYTLQGRLVKRLIRPGRKFSADNHSVYWDGSGDNGVRCAAGPYVYRLTTGRFVKARVMLMVR